MQIVAIKPVAAKRKRAVSAVGYDMDGVKLITGRKNLAYLLDTVLPGIKDDDFQGAAAVLRKINTCDQLINIPDIVVDQDQLISLSSGLIRINGGRVRSQLLAETGGIGLVFAWRLQSGKFWIMRVGIFR